MDYTNSLDRVIHGATGNPMHSDSIAVPTVWSDKDANSVIWSLMEVLKMGGVSGKAFNPDDPESYTRFRDALVAKFAPLDSPDFVGTPKAQTPPQFDNSKRVANMEALQRALGSYSGTFAYSAVSGVALTAADIGKTIVAGASAAAPTWTTPTMSTLPVGAAITICNLSGYNLSLVQQSVNDRYMSAFDPSNTATSFSVPSGTEVTLVKYSGSTWLVLGYGSLMRAQFQSSLFGDAGYKKIPDPNSPSGFFIEQWGAIGVAGSAIVTLPTTFPNQILGAFADPYLNNGETPSSQTLTGVEYLTMTRSTIKVNCAMPGARLCQWRAWGY
jgi:hypothetical protein